MGYDGSHELFPNLAKAALAAGVTVRRAAEVGVLKYQYSAIREFADAGTPCDFYEAVPAFCDEIEVALKSRANARLFRFALSDTNGNLDLYIAGGGDASTYAANQTTSPALVNDNFVPSDDARVTVECRDFHEVDPGDYDVVTIDVEGGEWPIVRRMKSRPTILALETHYRRYKNPHLAEIFAWCHENGYVIWYLTRSDTIFLRGTPPKMSLFRQVERAWKMRNVYGSLARASVG
ncbi:MAG TPA: FkbM family methyltransferase [Candidatus Baltobacteraceae bacterium]|nr:FkbM family methyltransferase [Candidatus Baltobacteraceae bacterium]